MALPIINPALTVPAPQAIELLDYEALQAAWLAEFEPLFKAATGEDYDVGGMEDDPGIAISEAMSMVRLNDRARINDAYSALRLARALGSDLDGLALDRGVRRLTYVAADPEAGTDAVMESDDALRLRTWLKMQTWGLGSPYGVEFAARTSGLGDVSDARCIDFPGEGRMQLILLPPAGVSDEFEPARARVAKHVMARERRPGAVWIDTVEADIIQVPISGTLGIRRGASDTAVVSSATATIAAYMASRRRIGALVPQSALDASAHVADVVWAHLTPMVDTPIPPTAAAEAGPILLQTVIADG